LAKSEILEASFLTSLEVPLGGRLSVLGKKQKEGGDLTILSVIKEGSGGSGTGLSEEIPFGGLEHPKLCRSILLGDKLG
jgi:hypothetical protein